MLPPPLRITSLLSLPLHGAMAAVILSRANHVALLPESAARSGAWVVVVFCAVSVALNALSRSRSERRVMVPLAAALFLSSLLVASAGPAPPLQVERGDLAHSGRALTDSPGLERIRRVGRENHGLP